MATCETWCLLVVCLVLFINLQKASSSQDVMKKLTVGFSKALDQCKAEMNIPDHILQDFSNFWREEYALVNRDLGCAIMCLASKFDLVTEDNKVHHQNAQEFARSHGADDQLAKQIVTMIHDCEQVHTSATIPDDCSRVLEIAKCFRTKIHELKWAPSMETVIEEVMIDMKDG